MFDFLILSLCITIGGDVDEFDKNELDEDKLELIEFTCFESESQFIAGNVRRSPRQKVQTVIFVDLSTNLINRKFN